MPYWSCPLRFAVAAPNPEESALSYIERVDPVLYACGLMDRERFAIRDYLGTNKELLADYHAVRRALGAYLDPGSSDTLVRTPQSKGDVALVVSDSTWKRFFGVEAAGHVVHLADPVLLMKHFAGKHPRWFVQVSAHEPLISGVISLPLVYRTTSRSGAVSKWHTAPTVKSGESVKLPEDGYDPEQIEQVEIEITAINLVHDGRNNNHRGNDVADAASQREKCRFKVAFEQARLSSSKEQVLQARRLIIGGERNNDVEPALQDAVRLSVSSWVDWASTGQPRNGDTSTGPR